MKLIHCVQILRQQTQRDAQVKELADAMVNVFTWAEETELLQEKIELLRNIIALMAKQVTECAVFIKDYTSRGFLGA